MKRILYTIISVAFLTIQVKAVEQQKVPQIIPASPDAAALGKYGAFPVNHNTGLPSIVIPVYEFKAGNITLPISLSYHASGIKVDDIASSVGLGWSLNAGGCISVQTNGRADYQFIDGSIQKKKINSLSFDMFTTNNISIETIKQLASNNENEIDAEHDIYNYNIDGNTGQFIIKDGINSDIQFLRNSNGIRISFNSGNRTFILIDNSGKQYIFKEIETTICRNKITEIDGQTEKFRDPILGSYSKPNITAWYVTKIVDASRLDTLSFLYDSGEEAYETRIRGYIKTYTTTCNQNTPSPRAFYSLFYNGDWNTIYNDQNYNYQDIKHYKYYLKQIVHNRTGNKIVFNSSIRNDLFGGKKIDKITVVNNNDSIYSWKLGYSYFTTLWKNPKDNYVDKRLKLVSIQKSSKFNKLENPYTFSYYNDIVDSKLPFRNCTNGYDHWGCFNSLIETDNDAKNALKSFPKMNDVVKYASHYLPTYSPMYNMFSIDTYYSITIPNNLYDLNLLITKMGNRNVNEEYTKALSLKEIKYPTGGKTTFYYETNKCSSAGGYFDPNTVVSGLRIQKVVSQTTNDSTIKTYSYEHGTSMYFSKPNYFYIIKDSYERQYMPGAPTGCMNFQNYPDFSNISNGELISYTKVEEKTSLGSDNWKTAYSYKNESLYDGDKIYEMVGVIKTNTFECSQLKSVYNYSDAVQPFNMKILGKSYKNGLLSNIKYFKKDILIKEEKYDYNYVDGNKIYSNITKPYEEELFWCASGYAETKRFYYYDIYYHQTGKNFLKRKKTTDYDQNGLNPVIKSTLYEYNADNELIKNLTDSLGDKTIKKEIKYPGDSYFNYYHGQPHPFQQMQILNMINYPIEQKTFVNNKLTDATITTYMSDNPSTSTGKILPNATYGLNTNTPLTDFTALSSGDGNTAYTIDPRMSQEITYNYYSDGNVREVFSPKTGITTTYLWSYNGQYPVAVVKNATYTQVNNAYHGSVDYLRNLIAPTNEVISSMSGLLRSNLPNSQIITYTYKPLVGMLTATDPRGVTTYYEYDDFNRLKETYIIENGLKKVLQKYDYHYQNQ